MLFDFNSDIAHRILLLQTMYQSLNRASNYIKNRLFFIFFFSFVCWYCQLLVCYAWCIVTVVKLGLPWSVSVSSSTLHTFLLMSARHTIIYWHSWVFFNNNSFVVWPFYPSTHLSVWNTSGCLGEQEMLWKHEPQAIVSAAFSSSPKLSRVFL